MASSHRRRGRGTTGRMAYRITRPINPRKGTTDGSVMTDAKIGWSCLQPARNPSHGCDCLSLNPSGIRPPRLLRSRSVESRPTEGSHDERTGDDLDGGDGGWGRVKEIGPERRVGIQARKAI